MVATREDQKPLLDTLLTRGLQNGLSGTRKITLEELKEYENKILGAEEKIYQLEGGILKWYSAGLSKTDDKISGMTTPEYAQLLNTEKAVLINFYAEWCEPCKKMEPYLLQMQKELANKVTIIRLNADENKTLVKEMKIDELPTLLLYKNKELTWKHTAFISEADLKNQLK